MNEKVDPGLFACLMQMSAAARQDLLEYIGQGPVSAEGLMRVAILQQVYPLPQACTARAQYVNAKRP